MVDDLSAVGSTWSRADVLRAVCDLTPPPNGVPGRRWATSIERAVDAVTGVCTTIDPPELHGPAREADGRSVWIAPVEPHLTSDGILAQEERILSFAARAELDPPAPSATVEREGLDVLQAAAAAAVAGHDPLVLVVGPAGTGKTRALRHAATDLASHGRPVFGVAPTSKAAKVLHDETGIPTDTIAKLLHEWRTGQPRLAYRLPPGTTLVVDESGMVGTSSLHQLVELAEAQRWRLVLVGDPRQLHAVGRGGMFDELCRTSRVHPLATIHRFRQRWEQSATLQLRLARLDALDAYFTHGRVQAGELPALLDDISRQWSVHRRAGRSVTVTAETNEHVAALNETIQHSRRARGELGPVAAVIADGANGSTRDIVVTRRNERTLTTDRGQPIRNRDLWTVTAIHRDGALTVSHIGRHGTVTLPAEYVREQVQLGYAATAHGQQGDTVDASIALVTAATTHRSLYVGATRGRQENQLLVVTGPDEDARDVLERVLTNDRVDLPAVAQRRVLAGQARAVAPRTHLTEAERALGHARRALDEALRTGEPELRALDNAEHAFRAAETEVRAARRALGEAPRLRRRGPAERVRATEAALNTAADAHASAALAAASHTAAVEARLADVAQAVRAVSSALLQERLDQLQRAPTRQLDRTRGLSRGR